MKSIFQQLVEINGENSKKSCCYWNEYHFRTHSVGITFHEGYSFIWDWYYKTRLHEYWPPMVFMGHSHGQIVAMETSWTWNCFLWDPVRRIRHDLPRWDPNLPFQFATLSSGPEDPKCFTVMVLTEGCSLAFFRWRKGEKAWIVQDFDLEEPFASNQKMEFVNGIGFQGKFYVLSLQGSLVVIEDSSSSFKITSFSNTRAVPYRNASKYREYLFEFDGEIMLVFLTSRKTIDVVDEVEVFRLDIQKLLWVGIQSLGDGALFLEDECCMGINAGKVGCRKNCIYFTHSRVTIWFVYDMELGQISTASGTSSGYMNWDESKDQQNRTLPKQRFRSIRLSL